jgi:hypothetical protein
VNRQLIYFSVVILLGADLAAAAQDAAPPPTPKPNSYEAEGRPGFVLIDKTESMPWDDFNIPGMADGIKARVLSRSPSMGAVSLMTYLPIGWRQDTKGYHNSDVEIFLLEGDLTISDAKGEQKLTKYSYTYIPAGMSYGPMSTQQGAVFIQWFKGKPDFVASNRDKQGARVHAAVRDWNYYHQSLYIGEPFPAYRVGGNIPGSIHELLRKDPDTGEMTWMVFSAGGGGGPAPAVSTYEIHPSFEEYYWVEASGRMQIGECFPQGPTPIQYGSRSYWWRPGGMGHLGPLSHSDPGYSLSLVRTGVRLWADYSTDCTYEQKVVNIDGKPTFVPAKK